MFAKRLILLKDVGVLDIAGGYAPSILDGGSSAESALHSRDRNGAE